VNELGGLCYVEEVEVKALTSSGFLHSTDERQDNVDFPIRSLQETGSILSETINRQ
jgi:hypothetical protein